MPYNVLNSFRNPLTIKISPPFRPLKEGDNFFPVGEELYIVLFVWRCSKALYCFLFTDVTVSSRPILQAGIASASAEARVVCFCLVRKCEILYWNMQILTKS